MKSFILEKFGFENCKYSEKPLPKIFAGEILIKVKSISLNYRDIMVIRGLYDRKLKLPTTLLTDATGTVVNNNDDYSDFAIDDRIFRISCNNWMYGPFKRENMNEIFGTIQNGVASEFHAFNEQSCMLIPNIYSNNEASTFTTSAITAWRSLVVDGKINSNSTVFIPGTSSVSLFALQIAHAFGATTIITSRSNQKLEKCRQLGADYTINSVENPDWEREVMKITQGEGVDITLEIGGKTSFQKSLYITRPGGTVAVIGGMSGFRGEFDLTPIVIKKLSVIGIYVGSRKDTVDMVKFFEEHKIHPVIDRVFPFDEIPQALHYLEHEDHFGKIVISLEDE